MGRGIFEGWHLIILLVIIVVLFGAKRLPDAARSLGRSARVFKSEVEEMKKDGKDGKGSSEASSASTETVRGESLTRERASDDVTASTYDGNAVHERTPRTDNQSGPAV